MLIGFFLWRLGKSSWLTCEIEVPTLWKWPSVWVWSWIFSFDTLHLWCFTAFNVMKQKKPAVKSHFCTFYVLYLINILKLNDIHLMPLKVPNCSFAVAYKKAEWKYWGYPHLWLSLSCLAILFLNCLRNPFSLDRPRWTQYDFRDIGGQIISILIHVFHHFLVFCCSSLHSL